MRKSIEQSIRSVFPLCSIRTPDRVRLSRGSILIHTSQRHAGSGTPSLVPVPRNVTVIAFCEPEKTPLTFAGTVEGKIAFEERGDGGFGFDPIFDYNGKTFGELGIEFKNTISHRRRALDKFIEWVKEQ